MIWLTEINHLFEKNESLGYRKNDLVQENELYMNHLSAKAYSQIL